MSTTDRLSTAISFLFVPGDRDDRFDRALASGADVVIVDLEDAVAAADKATARERVARLLDRTGQVVVRINADELTAAADLHMLAGARHRPRAVLVPKAESPQQLSRVHQLLGIPVLALLETAAGVLAAPAIAAAPGVRRLLFGAVDLSLDIDADPGDTAMLLARSTLVLASRVAGLPGPVDSPSLAIADLAEVDRAARHARSLGFAGKLCIHPAQIPAVLAAFRPTGEQVDWARRVLAGAADGRAAQVDGAMIDRPLVLRAGRILAAADEQS